jgi:RNA polymerase sigma factor
MREIDKMVMEAADDAQKLSALIERNETFILRSAAKTARRYVSKSDDEWSIALSAFYEAVKKYSYDRGSFIAFAELLINRRLIDYFRAQNKYYNEKQVESVDDRVNSDDEEESIKLEINAISLVIKGYGFTFMDLIESSPKAVKTKYACGKATAYLLKNPLLIYEMRKTKQLPLKIIEKNEKIPRKLLERHRKYIIAAVEILHGDYPYLAEYLSFIRGELK